MNHLIFNDEYTVCIKDCQMSRVLGSSATITPVTVTDAVQQSHLL